MAAAIAFAAGVGCAESSPSPSPERANGHNGENDVGQLRETKQAVLLGAKSISFNYSPPSAVQGVKDGGYTWNQWKDKDGVWWPDGNYDLRYHELGRLNASVAHASIVGWTTIDQVDQLCAGIPDEQACQTAVVANCPFRVTTYEGIHYCFDDFRSPAPGSAADSFLNVLRNHVQAKNYNPAREPIQTAMIIDGAPARYRNPGCTSYACVPRRDALVHQKNFVRYMAERFNCSESGGCPDPNNPGQTLMAGKLTHFIVGNEVGESQYFDISGEPRDEDPSTRIDVRSVNLSDRDKRQWVADYVGILASVHDGIAAAQRTDTMLWASLAQTFGSDHYHENSGWSIGGQRFVEALQRDLGLGRDWSIAIHPYGDPSADPNVDNPDVYVFESLNALSRQMETWLRGLGATDPWQHPQMKLFASEQSYSRMYPYGGSVNGVWLRSDEAVTEWMCRAQHYIDRNRNIVAVTHEHFQVDEYESTVEKANRPPTRPDGQPSGNSEHYGLVPFYEPSNYEHIVLTQLSSSDQGQVYLDTFGNKSWRKDDRNVCCRRYGVGCLHPAAPVGRTWGLRNTTTEVALTGYACAPAPNFNGPGFAGPLDVEIRAGEQSQTLVKRVRADVPLAAGEFASECSHASTKYKFDALFQLDQIAANQGQRLRAFAVGLDGNKYELPGGSFYMPSPPVGYNHINGWVDGIVFTPDLIALHGWACNYGIPAQVPVEVWAGTYPNVQKIKAVKMAYLNEPAVTSMCGGRGSNYRFQIPFTRAEVSAHQGKELHVLGFSVVGGGMEWLGHNSPAYMPTLPATYQQPGNVYGRVDAMTFRQDRTTLDGWACQQGDPRPIRLDVYVGGDSSWPICQPGGTSTCLQFVKSWKTDIKDDYLSGLCGTTSSTVRFEIPFTRAEKEAFQGLPAGANRLWVFAIHLSGHGPSPVLPRHNNFVMPPP